MEHKFETLLAKIGEAIQKGQGETARSQLQEVLKTKIPRKNLAETARLCVRLNLEDHALRILAPLLRPSGRKKADATDAEKVEYASALIASGATDEATALLDCIPEEKNPDVFLFRAFALFAKWNYKEAIPQFEAYLKAKNLTPYQRVIGEVNFASALVYERETIRAEKLLDSLLSKTEKENYVVLNGYVLQLAAQSAFFEKNYPKAENFLKIAAENLKTTPSRDAFFIRKWSGYVKAFCAKQSKAEEEFEKIRREALSIENWETLRDCDRWQAILKQDERLLEKVWMGTPFPSFRSRLLKDFGKNVNLPSEYCWALSGKAPTVTLNATTGEFSGKHGAISRGQVTHQLLQIIASDFYAPFRLASLHAVLYKGEFFNPLSSPERVHRVIRRLNKEFGELKLPLQIVNVSGGYKLEATKNVGILISPENLQASGHSWWLEKLKHQVGSELFTTAQASHLLGITNRTMSRYITDACQKGHLATEGVGRYISYRFPHAEKKAA